MTPVDILLAVLYALLLVGLYLLLRKPRHPEPAPNVVVHFGDGSQSISGVLLSRDSARLLIADAQILGEGADRDVPLAGEQWIPLARVWFVQESK